MSKNLLTIESFAEWCEKQPAEKTYNFWDCQECACGQYSKDIGISEKQGHSFWIDAQQEASGYPRTFGALAARLRSLSA